MPLDKPSFAVNNIQTLGTRTLNQGTAIKVLHDKAGADIKAFLIALCDQIDIDIATKAELAGIILGQVSPGSIIDSMLSDASDQIKQRLATHITDYVNRGFSAGAKNIDGANINILTDTGHYYGVGCIGIPDELGGYVRLQVISIGGINYCKQVVSGLGMADGGWSRTGYGSVWNPWVPMVALGVDGKVPIAQMPSALSGSYAGDGSVSARQIVVGPHPKIVFWTTLGVTGIETQAATIFSGGTGSWFGKNSLTVSNASYGINQDPTGFQINATGFTVGADYNSVGKNYGWVAIY